MTTATTVHVVVVDGGVGDVVVVVPVRMLVVTSGANHIHDDLNAMAFAYVDDVWPSHV